jgi:hypothetical protein
MCGAAPMGSREAKVGRSTIDRILIVIGWRRIGA